MLSSIIRLATRRGIALTAYRIHHAPIVIAHRSISLSRPHRASEESSFITGFKNSPLFAQLADKPEALQVLRDFAELLGKQGIDFSKSPSATTIIRLGANREFREAAANVVQELRKAGIDINAGNAFELLTGTGNGQGKPQ